eukprot:1161140-Pelagomonas_calceolata.AAC.17
MASRSHCGHGILTPWPELSGVRLFTLHAVMLFTLHSVMLLTAQADGHGALPPALKKATNKHTVHTPLASSAVNCNRLPDAASHTQYHLPDTIAQCICPVPFARRSMAAMLHPVATFDQQRVIASCEDKLVSVGTSICTHPIASHWWLRGSQL